MAFDQAKMLMQAKKLQTGEQKLKKVSIDPEQVDLNDIRELEVWIEEAVKQAIVESQQLAAEKMKPIMGNLGGLGF